MKKVYVLICENYNKVYVGQTKNELRKRMTLQRQKTMNDDLRVLKANKHIHEYSEVKFKVVPLV